MIGTVACETFQREHGRNLGDGHDSMNLFCFFGCHDLELAYSETEGFHRCKRCQQRIGEPWKVLRPEQLIAAQQAHAAVMRDRAERVKRLSEPERAKLVRMR